MSKRVIMGNPMHRPSEEVDVVPGLDGVPEEKTNDYSARLSGGSLKNVAITPAEEDEMENAAPTQVAVNIGRMSVPPTAPPPALVAWCPRFRSERWLRSAHRILVLWMLVVMIYFVGPVLLRSHFIIDEHVFLDADAPLKLSLSNCALTFAPADRGARLSASLKMWGGRGGDWKFIAKKNKLRVSQDELAPASAVVCALVVHVPRDARLPATTIEAYGRSAAEGDECTERARCNALAAGADKSAAGECAAYYGADDSAAAGDDDASEGGASAADAMKAAACREPEQSEWTTVQNTHAGDDGALDFGENTLSIVGGLVSVDLREVRKREMTRRINKDCLPG